jgi:hypothetical protein
VWLKLADDDVSELFVGSDFMTFVDGTHKVLQNFVVSQLKPHTVGKT